MDCQLQDLRPEGAEEEMGMDDLRHPLHLLRPRARVPQRERVQHQQGHEGRARRHQVLCAFKYFNDATLFPLTDGKITIDMSPKEWWQCYGCAWPTLQPIAIRVFSVGTSSSTSERNFSTWSHIWSNRANRLNFDRTVKLVYVFSNLRALQKLRAGTGRTDHVSSYWLEEEIEE